MKLKLKKGSVLKNGDHLEFFVRNTVSKKYWDDGVPSYGDITLRNTITVRLKIKK